MNYAYNYDVEECILQNCEFHGPLVQGSGVRVGLKWLHGLFKNFSSVPGYQSDELSTQLWWGRVPLSKLWISWSLAQWTGLLRLYRIGWCTYVSLTDFYLSIYFLRKICSIMSLCVLLHFFPFIIFSLEGLLD